MLFYLIGIRSMRPNSLPDLQIEHKYVEELDQFLHPFLGSNYTVSVMSVTDTIIRLKPKLSGGMDGIQALHIKNGYQPF